MKGNNHPEILAIALLCVAMMGTVPAAMIELSPADLQNGANLIVSGTVSGMSSQWDETHSMIYTDVSVAVSSAAKGQASAQIVVRVPGGEVGDIGLAVSDMPEFRVGEKATLYLVRTAEPSIFEVLGGCQGKTPRLPSADHIWSYSGYHWNATSVWYYDNVLSSWQSPIYNAKTAWNNAGSRFRILRSGTTTKTAPVYDGYNVVYRKSLGSGGILAQTTYWYYTTTKHVIECDMVYNTYYPWSTSGAAGYYDVQNIGTHEFGHFLVLNDLYDGDATEQTMYGYGAKGETKKRTLASGDIYGIKYIYGTFDRPGVSGGVADAGLRSAISNSWLRVFPNPFVGQTTLSYNVPRAGSASIKVLDVSGATVLTKAFRADRNGTVRLDASDLCDGVYLARVETGDFSAEQKLVVQH